MAWTSPRTWNAGETVTANLMNTHLRDNLNFLKTNVDASAFFKTVLSADYTARTGSGTGETDAWTYTLPANTLSSDGMSLRISVWGKNASGTSTRTFKLYWNGSSILTPANFTTASTWWAADSNIMRTGGATQTVRSNWRIGTASGSLNTATPAAATINVFNVWDGTAPTNATLSGTVAMKTTLQDGTAGTNITQLGVILELVNCTAAAAA